MNTEKFFDKMALEELADAFSSLANIKDTKVQAQLFAGDTKLGLLDGSFHSIQNGREKVRTACASFLALLDTVCHLSDQQAVDINETRDAAMGVAYCHVVSVGENEEGRRVQTTQGVRCNDEYIKINGEWKITNRTSRSVHIDAEEM